MVELQERNSDLKRQEEYQKSYGPTSGSHRTSSSRYTGVCWYRSSRKWMANIFICGKKVHLGYFNSEKEAALSYDKAAAAMGRRLNFACEVVQEPLKNQKRPFDLLVQQTEKLNAEMSFRAPDKKLRTASATTSVVTSVGTSSLATLRAHGIVFFDKHAGPFTPKEKSFSSASTGPLV
mmetsp:Transcript_6806/g.12632  ORF Transcript_6806/g.12632 Transcript_6806/m.12632 type:complete len:178 (+) Transcript_6806:348-881(+)|eukprot:CAMPEP_0171634984 /NCGR_PEP_ID=MMETSP0990-20121206/26339_1 /TAXON_ID=483369 /ORGANISM="non described non described, Strain CCMP2098" /LENGTH=177 /DNA_ID=CAMNT_0012206427 /DNA_START=168 /DNA_END=701 /DNA_ORIENTATION=-